MTQHLVDKPIAAIGRSQHTHSGGMSRFPRGYWCFHLNHSVKL
jgi:hypothetical protein